MAFVDFLAQSPTSYHACAEVGRRLSVNGFVPQLETEPWDPTQGGHFIARDGALIAYRLPKKQAPEPRFRIIAVHTDSPGFKLKPHPQHRAYGWAQAGMEVYGAPLLNSWLDREFGLAGRLILRNGEQRLIMTDPWFRIPQLAPHLDRTLSEGLKLDRQQHLMPVYATLVDDLPLMAALAAVALCEVDEIFGHDLFAYITQPPERFGMHQQFLAAARLDNLTSVYAGLEALLAADPDSGVIPILACFDHEEVGSQTRSGASGPFLEEVLARICLGLGLARDQVHRLHARSQIVSADAGHSIHPNYPTAHDPDEQPIIGAGPMLKMNAQQRYSTDGVGAALWRTICELGDLPCQTFVSNNAVGCGTTIGPLAATRLGMPTLDVGVPLLSMHSAREMCAPSDIDHLTKALTIFLTD